MDYFFQFCSFDYEADLIKSCFRFGPQSGGAGGAVGAGGAGGEGWRGEQFGYAG
jgi:hypothetical protein